MSTCRSCGAPVIWATNAGSGKWMILDAEPSAAGNVVVTEMQNGLEARVYSKPSVADFNCTPGVSTRHLDHHVTCPQAKEWRKKPGPQGSLL